uniref:Putative ovule protein n=1 Tax=Solanum chacoense TaxID=4108 RepID=A0A0V0H5J2_SOLCH
MIDVMFHYNGTCIAGWHSENFKWLKLEMVMTKYYYFFSLYARRMKITGYRYAAYLHWEIPSFHSLSIEWKLFSYFSL